MTSPTSFAGVPTLRDASPALPPPAQVTATSALADPPLGRGALSSVPPGYLDETKICANCSEPFYRFSKCADPVWARRTHCSKQKCANIAEKLRKLYKLSGSYVAPPQFPVPIDMGREAELFAGLSFADSTRAPVSLPRLTMLPEPNQSLMGNGTAMCASARRT